LRKKISSGETKLPEALCEAALRSLDVPESLDFRDIVVSLKASSVQVTVAANRLLSERCDYPLHVGVTEAGPLIAGVTRNTLALAELLKAGIGDTVRVSLSSTMENEVIAAREILSAVNENADNAERGVRIVSCPRCGRCSFDTHGFTDRWLTRLYKLKKNVSVAIMGCAVNGPGEAKEADLGITGAGTSALIFKHGTVIKQVPVHDADSAFARELSLL
jgi:(E)-4-hydroxy-3-methylbut-2-enyl-diphosphate synthase